MPFDSGRKNEEGLTDILEAQGPSADDETFSARWLMLNREDMGKGEISDVDVVAKVCGDGFFGGGFDNRLIKLGNRFVERCDVFNLVDRRLCKRKSDHE